MEWILPGLFVLTLMATVLIMSHLIRQLRRENRRMRAILYRDIDELTRQQYNELIDLLRQRSH